jgi:Protein of unknown function (DUF3307)
MIYQFVALLFVHWVADFVLQTHWQASNKSKNNEAIGRHVGVYTSVLAFAVPFIFAGAPFSRWLLFVVLNSWCHFLTDYCTSRATARLWAKGDTHNFFVVVGFDQFIHQATLAGTMVWLFGGVS